MRLANWTFAAAKKSGFALVTLALSNDAFHIGNALAVSISWLCSLASQRAYESASSGCLLLFVTAMLMPPLTPDVATLPSPGAAVTAISLATFDLEGSFMTE